MRDTGPVRRDVASDTGVAVPSEYVGLARTLLGQLKARMAAGGMQVLQRSVTLPDGTTVLAMSVHGQDTIRIYRPNAAAPRVPEVVPERPRIVEPEIAPPPRPARYVCLRGPDIETYSAPFTTSGAGFAAAAMNTARDTVYLITGAPDLNSYTNHTGVGNASVLYRLDSKLATVSGSASAYPCGAIDTGSVMVHYDRASERFFTAGYTLAGFQPILHPLPDPVVYKYMQVWDVSGATSQISTVVGTFTDVYGSEWAYIDLVISEGTANGIVQAMGFIPPGPDPALTNQVWGGGHIASYAPDSWAKIAEIKDTDGAGGGGFGGPGYDGRFKSVVTPAGNIVVRVVGTGGSGALYSVNAQNGSTITNWGVVPGTRPVTARMRKGANGDKELWAASDTGIYRNNGTGWKLVTAAGAPNLKGSSTSYDMLNLAYDETIDAMAVILPDGSGAHIFGGSDCMGAPLAPFTVKFKHTPAFDVFFCTQFEKGTLLVTYMKLDSNIDTTVASTMTVGRYDIGMLNQRRATVYE